MKDDLQSKKVFHRQGEGKGKRQSVSQQKKKRRKEEIDAGRTGSNANKLSPERGKGTR